MEKGLKTLYNSKLYSRARINALQLEEHKGRGKKKYDATCKLCGEEEEDIVHFTIRCSKLEQKRDYKLVDKEIKNSEDRMKELLFRNKNHIEIISMIKKMWELRRTLLKAQKEKKQIKVNPQ